MTKTLILTQAAFLRGTFINKVSAIEKMMEYYIANYFCSSDKNKIHEMVEMLTGDRFVSFESKRSAFEWVMKKHFNAEYIANLKNFQLLTSIQTERNKLAHLMINMTEEAVRRFEEDGTVSFLKFSGSTKPIWYNRDDMKRISDNANIVYNWIRSLINP